MVLMSHGVMLRMIGTFDVNGVLFRETWCTKSLGWCIIDIYYGLQMCRGL